MKKIIYKLALSVVATWVFASCSDFLDREPLTQPEALTFLTSDAQVENYINGLYTTLPSFQTYGMGVRSEEKNSDNIVAQIYDLRLNGEFQTNSASDEWQAGYQNLRKVNYFFNYYAIDEENESKYARSMRGEAYFMRAWWHYTLLKQFGSIPVMDAFWDNNATTAGLQIPAKPRNEVAKFILADLKTAAELLLPRSEYAGLRINREAAMVLAMNVALYEGTWEKYHASDKFAAEANESAYFLGKVLEWGDELFKLGTTLYTGGNDVEDPGSSFATLFNSKDLSNISEVLLWRKYSTADGVYHNVNPNLKGGVTDVEGAAGISRSLVNNYLNADASFINPKDVKFHDFISEFEGRDPRLLQTVMHEGSKWASATSAKPMHLAIYSEADKTISTPRLTADGNSRSLTGYHIRLGIDTTYVEGYGETALPIIRYAEGLLAYAEASAELNKFDKTVFDKTIGLLRNRAGVKDEYPFKRDPYNWTDYGYQVSEIIHEIRRERRSELALQGFRLDDLMRWAAAKLIVGQRGRGAYIGNDGILFQSFSSSEQITLRERLTMGDDGFADPMSGTLPTGYGFKADRDYLMPIPPSELELNKTLHQNPNW